METREEPAVTSDRERLQHRIEERTQQPNVCTVYPVDIDEDKLMATWISAKEGSFVDLDDCR